MAIKVITDSASDITKEEANQLGIELISMEVRIGEQVYLDGFNLSKNDFYEQLIHCEELPQTSQINAFRFEEVFDKIVEGGDEAIVISISSKLSGTFSNAFLAAEKYQGKIKVLDSLNASVGERLLVELALRYVKLGVSLEELWTKLEQAKHQIKFIARLDTLKYLKKGGRISPIVALGGEILAIKPVIGVIDGEVKLLGKARGSKNGNNLLTKMIQEDGGINFSMPYGAIYSGFSDVFLRQYMSDSKDLYSYAGVENIPVYRLGCTIGTHIGPNGIGVAYFSNKK